MEIKYEAVFGPQELFDSTVGTINEDALIVLARNDYKVFFQNIEDAFSWMQKDESYRSKCICSYAMRRIIAEPKCWTVEDQKAGRLPEVGAEVMCMDDSRHNFVGESIHAEHWALCHGKTKKVFHIPATAVRPVETDTERQQRLKEEWCHSALKLINDELTDACDAAVIYDALLSGDLPVPVKE